ncbi:MAG: hypothetical protein IT292_05310 [Deltaproteobacteria bacterium]|nr:hypothetical protein [Deltaproteobacteria bacterium]
MKLVIILSLLILPLFFCSCFGNDDEKKLLPGQCWTNMECTEGRKCNQDGWCEDIYFPKEKIQPL